MTVKTNYLRNSYTRRRLKRYRYVLQSRAIERFCYIVSGIKIGIEKNSVLPLPVGTGRPDHHSTKKATAQPKKV
jgi:hypothetical protein